MTILHVNTHWILGGGGGVLNRNSGWGVRPTQQNPDPVQDAKLVNFATLSVSKRKCCNFLPRSRLDQALPTSKQYKWYISLRIWIKAHKISENCVIEGGEKEKIWGDDPVQDNYLSCYKWSQNLGHNCCLSPWLNCWLLLNAGHLNSMAWKCTLRYCQHITL